MSDISLDITPTTAKFIPLAIKDMRCSCGKKFGDVKDFLAHIGDLEKKKGDIQMQVELIELHVKRMWRDLASDCKQLQQESGV